MGKNSYTIGNEDNLEKALDGLGQFCHNWCMNCEETEKENDPCFRCSECNFSNEDDVCSIKHFINKHAEKENKSKYFSMGW